MAINRSGADHREGRAIEQSNYSGDAGSGCLLKFSEVQKAPTKRGGGFLLNAAGWYVPDQ
jgi:hypothetical protein